MSEWVSSGVQKYAVCLQSARTFLPTLRFEAELRAKWSRLGAKMELRRKEPRS